MEKSKGYYSYRRINRKAMGVIALVLAFCLSIPGAFSNAKAASNEGTWSTILPMDTEWSYWYGDTTNPVAKDGWQAKDFDASDWKSLKGPLGYGSASKVPDVPYNSMTENNKVPYNSPDGTIETLKVPTTYYRTEFNIADMNKVKMVSGTAHYDDAAIVYVNGVERVRLGAFADGFDVKASAAIIGGDATGATKLDVPAVNQKITMLASWFKEGKNTIAVVMFQDTGSSSDCLLGLEITASDTLILASPDRINVTFYDDTKTTKAITWISDGNGDEGIVQYIDASTVNDVANIDWNTANIAKANRSEGAEVTNKAIIRGLTAGASYYYRVGGNDTFSSVGKFTTAGENDGSFSFIHVTDPQGSSEVDFSNWSSNITGAMSAFPQTSFIVNTGDFVNDGLDESEWKYCFNLPADTIKNTTLVPVVGNHEGYDYLGSFNKHFTLDAPYYALKDKGSYYSFDYENVHFTVLNTDEKENEDLSAKQLSWLKKDLSKASKNDDIEWIIVALHRSLYSSGDHSTDGDVINFRTSIGELLDKYGVDIVLSGHDHVYMRTESLYAGVAQDYVTEEIDGISYAVNPVGTTHIIPATISTKNYELNKNADYRLLQAAKRDGSYDNERQRFVSYSLLTGSKYYPEGIAKDSSVFVNININKNKLLMETYAVKDGEVDNSPFDSYAILKDLSKETKEIKKNNDTIKELDPLDYPFTGEGGSTAVDKNIYEKTIYDAEAYFLENKGTQGDIWYYYFEENDKLNELVPMKGKVLSDGTTGAEIISDSLYSQHPYAINIGNDSVQNGSVRLYDGAHDGNPRPEGERMTLVPYSDESNEVGKDDIVVAWKAPKTGWIKVTDWNPEFVGIIPAEKYLNSYDGFWVDIRLKKGSTGLPTDASNYREDSISILDTKSYPENGDGVVSGGAPKLIDKGGMFDGTYTEGAFVQVSDLAHVEEGDFIYYVAHCGNNYGWRGVILDSSIKYAVTDVVDEATETNLEENIETDEDTMDEEAADDEIVDDESTIYKVVAGDTLKKIAKKLLGSESDWKKIYEWNKDEISNSDRIYINQELKIYR